MKMISSLIVLAGLLAAATAQNDFTVNLPADQTQCASTVITWENGVGPYGLLVFIGRDGAASPVIDTGGIEGTSYPLLNDASAGYTVEIQVTEDGGHNALTQYTIQPSSNTSCLPGVDF